MSWFSSLADICQPDAPLAEHTWYGLGGPARWLFTPRDERGLAAVLGACAQHGIPCRMLGHGANVLVRDAGFDGAVIKLTGPAWEEVRFDDPLVHAAAGADFPRLVKQTVERGLLGLESLAGIPGTVGGAVRMNAGGRYGSIGQFVRDARIMKPDGAVLTRTAAELGFAYRACELNDAIVLAATFTLQSGDRTAGLERFRRIWNEKYASQPAVSVKSAGCIFKNPPGQAAGKLIDEAGLKGVQSGGAEISTKHANFIVADSGARAQDVINLIELAQRRVRERTGIELELEVEIW